MDASRAWRNRRVLSNSVSERLSPDARRPTVTAVTYSREIVCVNESEVENRALAHSRQRSRRATMIKLLHHFMADKSGAPAIEYSLIAAGIAFAIIVAVGLL